VIASGVGDGIANGNGNGIANGIGNGIGVGVGIGIGNGNGIAVGNGVAVGNAIVVAGIRLRRFAHRTPPWQRLQPTPVTLKAVRPSWHGSQVRLAGVGMVASVPRTLVWQLGQARAAPLPSLRWRP